MSSNFVVKNFNVLKDACFSLLFCKKTLLINQFSFQGAKERFCDGVVVTVAFTAHTLDKLKFVQQFFETRTCILSASIRMKDAAWFRLSTANGLFKCIYNQLLGQMTAHRPAYDFARETVQNHGKIEPTFTCPDIGNVAKPNFIGSLCREVLTDKIWSHWQLMPRIGGHFESAPRFRADAILLHQASYPVFTAVNALSLELMGNAGRTINTPAHCVSISDFFKQQLVFLLTLVGAALLPGVIAAPGYSQYPADLFNPKFGVVF